MIGYGPSLRKLSQQCWVDLIERLNRCALLQLKVTDMLALSRLRSTGPRRKNGSARCSTAGVAKPNCFSALLDGLKGTTWRPEFNYTP
jgi:hypothetical protein